MWNCNVCEIGTGYPTHLLWNLQRCLAFWYTVFIPLYLYKTVWPSSNSHQSYTWLGDNSKSNTVWLSIRPLVIIYNYVHYRIYEENSSMYFLVIMIYKEMITWEIIFKLPASALQYTVISSTNTLDFWSYINYTLEYNMYLEFIILKYADKKSNRHVILLQSKLTLISNGPQRRQTMLPQRTWPGTKCIYQDEV